MKCLIFSDSHGRVDYMKRAVEAEKPDRVIHLGDVVRDAWRLEEAFPELTIEQVRGNCDSSGCGEAEERELLLGGKRLWLLHGHTYHVKMELGLLAEEARVRGVDGVFFGHTHQPVCYLDGRLWVLNPGAIGGSAQKVTYGVLELEDGKMNCRTAVLR